LVCRSLIAQKEKTDEDKPRAAIETYVIDFWVKRDTTAIKRAVTEKMIYHCLDKTYTSKHSIPLIM